MYPVTQDFLEKVRADERRILGRVAIDFTDWQSDQSIQVTANELANVSYPGQIADGLVEASYKYASLDGSTVLDGTYHPAPSAAEAATVQMGWWGSQIAGVDGTFVSPFPILTITHAARPVWSLSVTGDNKRSEWPVDFVIRLYDSVGTLLHTENVTGTTLMAWSKEITAVVNVARQELDIRRWSHAGRQAKILEFFTSIQEIYDGEQIISLSLLEECEVGQAALPVGNISANELEVRLQNIDRRFDAGNPTSPLRGLLKTNRRVRAWLGVDTAVGQEWVPLGVYWTGDWHTDEREGYVKTTARDRMELLRTSTYSASQVAVNTTLYDLAIAVLQDAGLTTTEYLVDTELQGYAIPYAWFDPQSHREALRKIAEACLGQVYCDRHGKVVIDGPSALARQGAFLMPSFPALVASENITADSYFGRSQPLRWGEVANYIEVDTQPLRPDVVTEVHRSNEPVPIAAGETKTLTVYYNHVPGIEAVASLVDAPTGATITTVTYYAWGADVTVNSPTAGTFILVINAKPVKVLNKERAIAQDDASIREHGTLRYAFPCNPLVQSLVAAQRIVDTLLRFYRDPHRDVEVTWRGNPALTLGDVVVVPDFEEKPHYHVVRQTLDYAGGLTSQLTGRKV